MFELKIKLVKVMETHMIPHIVAILLYCVTSNNNYYCLFNCATTVK